MSVFLSDKFVGTYSERSRLWYSEAYRREYADYKRRFYARPAHVSPHLTLWPSCRSRPTPLVSHVPEGLW
jgi:hypothetical protein